MDDNPICPVCGIRDWEQVREYRYLRPGDSAPATRFGEYVKLRHRVLFEIWFPGSEEATLTSVMCRRCGFMCFTPRPTAEDIDAKYRFLQTTERDIGGQRGDAKSAEVDRKRAERVYRTVVRHRNGDRLCILDAGGGNGKLLRPFIERGHSCSLVDYNVNPLPGVDKIADRLEDVEPGRRFDVIISSHVLEHLAHPNEAIQRMANLLDAEGVFYGEVPVGIWGGIGIEEDPVTHINFFARRSFELLFVGQGMEVLESRAFVGAYNRRMDVIVVVARRAAGESGISFDGALGEPRRLLSPSNGDKVRRLWRLRRFGGFIGR
jgi:SAM-dependent methyltransferase